MLVLVEMEEAQAQGGIGAAVGAAVYSFTRDQTDFNSQACGRASVGRCDSVLCKGFLGRDRGGGLIGDLYKSSLWERRSYVTRLSGSERMKENREPSSRYRNGSGMVMNGGVPQI